MAEGFCLQGNEQPIWNGGNWIVNWWLRRVNHKYVLMKYTGSTFFFPILLIYIQIEDSNPQEGSETGQANVSPPQFPEAPAQLWPRRDQQLHLAGSLASPTEVTPEPDLARLRWRRCLLWYHYPNTGFPHSTQQAVGIRTWMCKQPANQLLWGSSYVFSLWGEKDDAKWTKSQWKRRRARASWLQSEAQLHPSDASKFISEIYRIQGN